MTGIIEGIEPLRQTLDERQESLSWAAKRLSDTRSIECGDYPKQHHVHTQ